MAWSKMKTKYESKEKAKAAAKRKRGEKGVTKTQVRQRKGHYIVKFKK